jgi:hypothetical protein
MAIESTRAVYFPYCLQRQKDGSWVFLNRNYKPIGFNTDDYITYENQPVSMRLEGLGPAMVKKLSVSGCVDYERIYLYKDGSSPATSKAAMTDYLEKLGLLMSLKTLQS